MTDPDRLDGALDRWHRLARLRGIGNLATVTLLVVATATAVAGGPEVLAWVTALAALAVGGLVMFWVRPAMDDALDDPGTEADRG